MHVVDAGPVLYSKKDGVATITLNRPREMNAINRELVTSLREIIKRIRDDESVHVAVIRGNDRCFCAGGDLKFLKDAAESVEKFGVFSKFVHSVNDALLELEALPVPVIAVVKGLALAGGFEIMLACDMALAADDARIGDQHANVGLTPGAGGTARLIRKIGLQYAMELVLTGKSLSGKEAARIGLVLRSVPGEALEDEVAQLLANLKDKSRAALGFAKRAMIRGLEMPMRQGLDEETFALFEYFATSPDPMIGINAFVDKRKPDFRKKQPAK